MRILICVKLLRNAVGVGPGRLTWINIACDKMVFLQ